jgi:hypothetical protein
MLRNALAEIGVKFPDSARQARWISTETSGAVGTVGSIVPARFASYARIFHPSELDDGRRVMWGEVATLTGKQMHPLAQWHALARGGCVDREVRSEWPGRDPEVGSLPMDIWKVLSKPLQVGTPEEGCFCALWTGWASLGEILAQEGEEGAIPSSSGGRSLPSFGVPPLAGRDYVLLEADLALIPRIAQLPDLKGRLPNMIWPFDRAWFLATDIDFDSTLVGGNHDLIRMIVEESSIEACCVQREDSLADDADRLN